jgi:hypothetical protein
MKEIKTSNGKKGGLLKGKPHYDKQGNSLGGIKAVVTDSGNRPVELEGGEVIINKEASKKHWKLLSKINQSAGNGVPIGPPAGAGMDEDPEEFKEGGRIIEFNPNHIPNKWVVQYAEKIKKENPEIWKLGGNIFGNEAFENLLRVSKRGHWLDSEEWMYIKWRSYVARHKGDFRIEGVVAMLKWCDKVEKGWAYMKDLIEENIEKIESKKMETGGELKKGIKAEKEHIKTIKKIYNRKVPVSKAPELIAKDHLKEDKKYYSKLEKMEGKKFDTGGPVNDTVIDKEGNVVNIGDTGVLETRKGPIEIKVTNITDKWVIFTDLQEYKRKDNPRDKFGPAFLKYTKSNVTEPEPSNFVAAQTAINTGLSFDEKYSLAQLKFLEDYRIDSLPQYLRDLALKNQMDQGNFPKLEIAININQKEGNFDWDKSNEGEKFWQAVQIGNWASPEVLKVIKNKWNLFNPAPPILTTNTTTVKTEFKIGDKVKIPTTKKGKPIISKTNSVVVERAKKLGQDYLFVTDIDNNIAVLDTLMSDDGDFFDFDKDNLELYIEPSQEPTATKKPNTVIVDNLEILNKDLDGIKMSWDEANRVLRDIRSFSDAKLQGWRLPTKKEFETIIYPNKSIIPDLKDDYYWTSTQYETTKYENDYYWVFDFDTKAFGTGVVTDSFYVRPVRDVSTSTISEPTTQTPAKKKQKAVEPQKRKFVEGADYVKIFQDYLEKENQITIVVTEKMLQQKIVDDFIIATKDVAGFDKEKLKKINSHFE